MSVVIVTVLLSAQPEVLLSASVTVAPETVALCKVTPAQVPEMLKSEVVTEGA